MTPQELKDYAANQRSNVAETLVVTCPVTQNTYQAVNFVTSNFFPQFVQAMEENGSDIRQIVKPSETMPTRMRNMDYIKLAGSAFDKLQSNNDVFKQVLDLIDAGTITTTDQVDSNWQSLLTSYQKQRITAPTNEALNTLITQVASTIPKIQPRDFAQFSPVIDSVIQISPDRDAYINVPVNITALVSVGSIFGAVFLEYADTADMITNLNTFGSFQTLGTNVLTSIIPAGKFFRIRKDPTSINVNIVVKKGQRVLL